MVILIFIALCVCMYCWQVYVVYAGDHGGLLPEEVADIHHSMLVSVKGK